MSTQELRDAFQISNLFVPGEIVAHFTDLDRLVVGGVTPSDKAFERPNHKETGRTFFLERRELGTINIGDSGIPSSAALGFAARFCLGPFLRCDRGQESRKSRSVSARFVVKQIGGLPKR